MKQTQRFSIILLSIVGLLSLGTDRLLSYAQGVGQDSVLFFTSFESAADTAGWQGVSTSLFKADAPLNGGTQSLFVSGGCIISGGRVVRSVLSPDVRINSYCEVESSILMHNADIGRYSRIRRAIIDANVKIPESSNIGYDLAEDRAKGYHVTESGIVVVPSRQERFLFHTQGET